MALWTIKIPTQKSRSIFFWRNSPPQVKNCRLNLWCNNSSSYICWKMMLKTGICNYNYHFYIFNLSGFEPKNKMIVFFGNFSSRWLSQMKEMNHFLFGKSGYQHPAKSKKIFYGHLGFSEQDFSAVSNIFCSF